MGKAYRHIENIIRGSKFGFTWIGGSAGDTHDWTGVSVSMRIINTSDDSQVEILSPTVTTSGDNDEIVTAVFTKSDTSSWPTGTLKGDIDVSGEPTLGNHTPVEVIFYVTADITT